MIVTNFDVVVISIAGLIVFGGMLAMVISLFVCDDFK